MFSHAPTKQLNSETGVTGKITVNGKNRSSNSENFRNVSAYIHQDDALRPYLTVREAMTMATHLKLGFNNITSDYKMQLICWIWIVETTNNLVLLIFHGFKTISIVCASCIQIQSILELLGLETRYNTKCGKLSGGQMKRMGIALELISNPSVIFLDEPTT